MAFTFKVRLPQYRGAEDITVRVYEPGESVRMNGDADDAMVDTASDGLFLATIAEDLVGDFEYEIFRAGTTIQTGVLSRVADQATVLADNPEDLVASISAATSGGTNGNGQFQIAITAAVGATAVRNVRISIEGTDTFTHTGTLGTATLNVDAGTYTLIVTPPSGYEQVADIEVTVTSANVSEAIALTATTSEVAEAPYCNVTIPVLDQYVAPVPDKCVKVTFISFLTGSTRTGVIVNVPPDLVSDADGLVEVRLARLAKYSVSYRVGAEPVKTVLFSTPDAGSYTVTEPLP